MNQCDQCERRITGDEKRYRLINGEAAVVCPDCAYEIDNDDPTPYCTIHGPKSACTCPPHPAND